MRNADDTPSGAKLAAVLTVPSPVTARPSDTTAITVDGLSVRLGGRRVLRDIGFTVAAGSFVGILGPNGCGKTTLLRCIAGLQRPCAGQVRIEGEPVSGIAPASLARRLAVQAQDSVAALGFTVRDVVGMGRLVHRRILSGDANRDRAVIDRALTLLELEALADRPIERLSGGERQRAAIARALAQEPRILLLDEPTNHLDIRHRFAVLELARALGITVLATLHEIDLAGRYCDRILLMSGGRIIADAPPEQALTAGNLAAVYGVRALVDRHPDTGTLRIDFHPMPQDHRPCPSHPDVFSP